MCGLWAARGPDKAGMTFPSHFSPLLPGTGRERTGILFPEAFSVAT